jgi:hypothetical protein
VAGKPRQHRSDHLGLLLRKAAASLTAQQLHLVGEPWRPQSCSSTPAAALAGGGGSGLARRWLGTRIGVGHARLPAPPRLLVPLAAFHDCVPRLGECRTRSRSCLDHADQGVARPLAPTPARTAGPDHDSLPRLHGDVALNVPRHRGPAKPRMDPGPTTRLAGVAQRSRAAHARRNRPSPRHGGGASVRSPVDHRPLTRSAARSSIDHPPLGGAAAAGVNDRVWRGHGGPACCGSHHQFGREPDVPHRDPTPVRQPREPANPPGTPSARPCRSGAAARRSPGSRAVGPAGQGRNPSRASSPTSHLRPTRSSARIRLIDHPCSTCRALR